MTFLVRKLGERWVVIVNGYHGYSQLLATLIHDWLLDELPQGLLLFDGNVTCKEATDYYVCEIK